MLGRLLTAKTLGNPKFLTSSDTSYSERLFPVNPTQFVKKALSIKKDDFYEMLSRQEVADNVKSIEDLTVLEINKPYLWKQFCNLPTHLLTRPECETDEKYLQIIPYIVLQASDYDTTGNVFCYKRGGGSGEKRLVNSYSVGYGGHIEEQTPTNHAITECVIRELFEEIGLCVLDDEVTEALKSCTVFHDTSNDVGKVHLALLINIRISEDDLGKEEIGSIEDTHLSSAKILLERLEKGEIDIEVWSQLALGIDKRLQVPA